MHLVFLAHGEMTLNARLEDAHLLSVRNGSAVAARGAAMEVSRYRFTKS